MSKIMIEKLLETLRIKRKVLIQTHNNPDPDTIAAAFALKNLLFNMLKKRVTIAYSGIIGRAENREFVRECQIDMHIITKLDLSRYDYIILVDSQPGAGNTYNNKRMPDAIIDHHNLRSISQYAKFCDIRINYGSTSTIITEYYKELQLIPDMNTATALYYGIKTDTYGTARRNTQKDMDMISFLFPYISVKKITKIESPELPRYYFKNIKKAIEQSIIIQDLIFCDLGEVRNSDLIAEMSDFMLRMRDIKSTFVIGKIDSTCYFSIRYKTNKKSVGAIALAIVRGIGYGGGHMKSAGGQIPLKSKTYEQVVEILKSRLIKRMGIENLEEKNI